MRPLPVVFACALAVGCSGGGTNQTPSGRVRVMNLYAIGDGGVGPTLDIYPSLENVFDNSPQPSGAKPLIAGLAFGQVSDYVTVFARPGNQGQLSYYRAGTRDAAGCLFGCTPPSGFKAGDQATVIVDSMKDSRDVVGAGFLTSYEHGSTEMPAPDAGLGMIIGMSAAATWTVTFVEWSTGGTCLRNSIDSQTFNGGVGFELAPGTIQLQAWETATFTCTTTHLAGPTAVTVAAGARQYAIVYGSSKTDMRILAVPIP